jgi:vacuolar-type H+-ATPase catalytic subunit A/Vma1
VNKKETTKIILDIIQKTLNSKKPVKEESKLIGEESLLDSMKLIEVCIALEDFAQSQGFEFDWTSNSAMSKSKSIFRNISTLSNEFFRQSKGKN